MTINRDTAVFVGYALVQGALTLATAHGYVSKADTATYSEVLLAFAAAYHIPNAKASAALKQVNSVPPESPPAEIPDAVH